MKIKKALLISVSATTLMANLGSVISAQAQGPEVDAAASITVDYGSGQILQGDNIDEALGIASITKMIVEYIVFEEIEAGNIDWDSQIKISDYAYEISQNYVLSNVPLRKGEEYSLEELYHAMAIYSANGATIAIAEAIAGTESSFVDRMKKTVESFGIDDASLFNSTGLHNSYLNDNIYPDSTKDDENSMSARSIAIIANRIIKDYPEILETASVPRMTFREGTDDEIQMENWNWMLEGLLLEKSGVDGLKTGTTDFAGATFTGTASQGDRRVITVVLDSGTDRVTRFRETGKLMDFGFDNFRLENVTESWKEQLEYNALIVENGKEEELNYEPSEALEMLLQLGDNIAEDLDYRIEWDENIVSKDGTIEAPISEGMELGRLVVSYSENELGYLEKDQEDASVPLLATESVEEAGIFSKIWTKTLDFFKGLKDRLKQAI